MASIYATTDEFTRHPTGLNVQNLTSGGQAIQTAELAVLMQLASQYVEQITYQPLYARTVVETKHVRPDPYGTLTVRLDQWPAQQLVSAQWRQTANQQSWTSINLAQTDQLHFGERRSAHIVAADYLYTAIAGWGLPPLTVQVQYVAGYPNAVLTSSVSSGATSVPVDDPTGIATGTALTFWDAPNQEQATVASVSGTTVTFTSGLQYGHAQGVRVSAVPAPITTATILIAAWLIKERRAGGGIMMGGKIQPMDIMAAEDMQMVRQLLQPWRRVV